MSGFVSKLVLRSSTLNPVTGLYRSGLLWGLTDNEIIRIVPSGFVIDPNAATYIAAVEAAKGSSVSTPILLAIDNFFKAEKAAGRWALHKRIYLPIWANSAANALDLVTGVAGGTWVNNGNMEHGAGFVRSFGASNVAGHFNTGVSPATLGLSNAANYLVTILLKTASAQTFAFPFDTASTGHSELGFNFSGADSIALGAPSINAGAIPRLGIFANGRDAGTAYFKRRTTSGVVTSTGTSTTYTPTTSPFIFTALSNNGVFNEYAITSETGQYTISLGMSQANADAFTLNLKTLWETTTGLTLP